EPATRDVVAEECELFSGGHASTRVDVIGAEHHASELRVRVGVLERHAAAGKHTDALGPLGLESGAQAGSGSRNSVGPRNLDKLAITAKERSRDAVVEVLPREREAILVGDPLLVDNRVLVREATQDLAATVVRADRGARGVV